jgi:DNA-binding transcriptional MerR regulator
MSRPNRETRKSKEAFRTISEAADELDVPQHVLRFWETKFSQIRPMKRAGNRRYYRPEDVELLRVVRHHLYDDGYTIKGVQKLLKEKGVKATVQAWGKEQASAPTTKKEPGSTSTEPAGSADLELAKELLKELKALRETIDSL